MRQSILGWQLYGRPWNRRIPGWQCNCHPNVLENVLEKESLRVCCRF